MVIINFMLYESLVQRLENSLHLSQKKKLFKKNISDFQEPLCNKIIRIF